MRTRAPFGGKGPRVGDPGTDATGTVRRSPDGRWLALLLPSPPHRSRWHVQDQHGSGGYEADERVAHWPVVGVVPWSPAAGVPLDGSVPTVPRRAVPGAAGRTCPWCKQWVRVKYASGEAVFWRHYSDPLGRPGYRDRCVNSGVAVAQASTPAVVTVARTTGAVL